MPTSYLNWMIDQTLATDLDAAVREELQRREGGYIAPCEDRILRDDVAAMIVGWGEELDFILRKEPDAQRHANAAIQRLLSNLAQIKRANQ